MSQPTDTIDRSSKPDWADFVHTGPDTLAGRYLRSFWQPIHNARLLKPGRAVPIRIMGEDLTLYRGEGDPRTNPPPEGEGTEAHLLAFRCAHRGTQLSTGWVEGDDLRCFYHGWKYDGSGQCIEQPAEPEPFCQRIKVRSYPVREYLGLVFAFLGKGEPPKLPRYPIFDDFDGVLLTGQGYAWPCNFFNQLDNDPIHPAFVHRQHGGKPPQVDAREAEFGIAYRASYPNGGSGVAYKYMPNVRHYSAYPMPGTTERWQGLTWRLPIDDGHCLSFTVRAIPARGDVAVRYESAGWGQGSAPLDAIKAAEAVLRGERPVQELETLPDGMALQAQDYVSLVGQGVIPDRDAEHLGREDATVILLRSLWQREMRALAEGRPLKAWRGAACEPATGDD